MPKVDFHKSVFINCPFDSEYEPLLEAMVFTCVCLGFEPLLASIRLDAGENRLSKIIELIRSSKFSIHDLSRHTASKKGELFRMNMPFEYGMDYALKASGKTALRSKKFLVFEQKPYDLKKALSDVAGQDVEAHYDNFSVIISKVRNFLYTEGNVSAHGAARIQAQYATFQGWFLEKKLYDGHSENEVRRLPTKERIEEMQVWFNLDQPSEFSV